MRSPSALVSIAVLAACGAKPAADSVPLTPELVAADVAVARAGCVRCHADPGPGAERRAMPRGPDLREAVRWHAADGAAGFLQNHHGGAAAADLAAWVVSLGAAAEPAVGAPVRAAAGQQGERLVRELACAACHAPAWFEALPLRTDQTRLAAFLAAPTVRHPDLVHVPLTASEAADVAAWLLRSQQVAARPVPGFAWSSWQLEIDSAGLPDVAGQPPFASGVAERIDVAPAPRKNNYLLRFEATLDVPTAGEWTFVTGSDDSSWLWLDGQQVVKNEGLSPHRRRQGKVTLTAGPHELAVAFTQAGGGASLEVLWSGPGVDEQPLPAARARAIAASLVPPAAPPAPAAEAVARGRAAARALRCDACHGFDDAAFAALPAPAPARPWRELGDAPCPQVPAGQALRAASVAAAARPADPALDLGSAMLRDGCLACHRRDGQGGLPPAVQAQLTEVEDLGDEGRLPPDLTAVGRRLRPAWLEKVLREGHAVRPYLRVRMPKVAPARAAAYAQWFAAVDAAGRAPASEPPFAVEAVHRGRQLAGTGGRNCITCHTFQGHRSLGPQGMDLSIQHERLLPGWFDDWLLQPTVVRPGTRMPSLWLLADAEARAEVAAIRTWLSLGASAPLPSGIAAAAGSLVLLPDERPRLHGAFLEGVSARCLAVGTPERTHFAFDLATPRLVWVWRGEFLDASGTWSGRAGQLLKPRGADWRVLADAKIQGGAKRRLLGQSVSPDGYPVLRVAVGEAVYEDSARPRLTAAGSEVVRTVRCLTGPLDLAFAGQDDGVKLLVGGVPAGTHRLAARDVLEVVYQW